MQVGPGADGIQKLLQAEQAAQGVIQSARLEKSKKIKQAQHEAEKEVAAYKTQREDAYKSLMEQGRGDAAGRLSALEEDTKSSIESLGASVASKKTTVVSGIVKWVTTV
jgi:V-type H+-transporting ATPase subunit G